MNDASTESGQQDLTDKADENGTPQVDGAEVLDAQEEEDGPASGEEQTKGAAGSLKVQARASVGGVKEVLKSGVFGGEWTPVLPPPLAHSRVE